MAAGEAQAEFEHMKDAQGAATFRKAGARHDDGKIEKLEMHSPTWTHDKPRRSRGCSGCVTEARGEDGKIALRVRF